MNTLTPDHYGLNAAADAARRPGKPLYRFKSFWVVLTLLVLGLAVRLALAPLATRYTQKGLDSLTGYYGNFKKVSVSLFPPRYTIEDLKLQQRGQEGKEPVLYVKSLVGKVLTAKLFQGQLVATVSAHQVKFAVKAGLTEAPPEVIESGKKVAREVKKANLNIGEVLEKIIPLRADRIEARDSEMLVRDATDPKGPELWISDGQLAVENLVTRKHLDQQAPLALSMRAVVAKTGTLKVLATADLYQEKPAFTGEAQLSNLQLASLHEWTAAKAGVSAKGNLNAFVNFNSAKGLLSGDVKVLIRDAKVDPINDKLDNKAVAAVGNLAISVLSNKDDGRKSIGTTLPLKGTLESPEAQIWPTILGVVRNAFVESVKWGFEDLPTPTAKKKQDPIEQVSDALDNKGEGPKAQPR